MPSMATPVSKTWSPTSATVSTSVMTSPACCEMSNRVLRRGWVRCDRTAACRRTGHRPHDRLDLRCRFAPSSVASGSRCMEEPHPRRLASRARRSRVVWTGGEPMFQCAYEGVCASPRRHIPLPTAWRCCNGHVALEPPFSGARASFAGGTGRSSSSPIGVGPRMAGSLTHAAVLAQRSIGECNGVAGNRVDWMRAIGGPILRRVRDRGVRFGPRM